MSDVKPLAMMTYGNYLSTCDGKECSCEIAKSLGKQVEVATPGFVLHSEMPMTVNGKTSPILLGDEILANTTEDATFVCCVLVKNWMFMIQRDQGVGHVCAFHREKIYRLDKTLNIVDDPRQEFLKFIVDRYGQYLF